MSLSPGLKRCRMHRRLFSFMGVQSYRLYDPSKQLIAKASEGLLGARAGVPVYSDAAQNHLLFTIRIREPIGFDVIWDVHDPVHGLIGALRKVGWTPKLRRQLEVLDPSDQRVGLLIEDGTARALFRRMPFGDFFLPHAYVLSVEDGRVVAEFNERRRWRYTLDVDFARDDQDELDRRFGLACAIVLAIENQPGVGNG